MKFPNVVVIVRPKGEDEYGNPSNSFDLAEEIPTKGFRYTKAGSAGGVQRADVQMLLPVDPAVRAKDRLRIDGVLHEVIGDPVVIQSPAKSVMTLVALKEVP